MPKDAKKEVATKPKVKKPGISRAKMGNDHAKKLKDPNIRDQAYDEYCAHIAEGYPKEAFFFSHPTESISYKTMDKYIAECPEDFPPSKMEQAKSKRYQHWFGEGKTLMQGKYKNGSPVVWQTIMRNVFKNEGWDRDLQTSNAVEPEARSLLKKFENK